MQVLNPTVALFILAFLPQFVDPARGAGRRWLTRIGGGVYIGLGVLAALSGPRPATPTSSG